MHVAAFIGTIGVFLGVVGPWITMGKFGSKSGVHYTDGLILLGIVAVMAAAAFYAITRKLTKKPVPWQAVVVYMVCGVAVAVYAFILRGMLINEVSVMAGKFRVSPSTLLAWGIKSIPFTGLAVTLAGIAAFLLPGEVGGVDESAERRRLG